MYRKDRRATNKRALRIVLLAAGLLAAALIVLAIGAGEPPEPAEVQQAISQERELWREGAPSFVPREYQEYLSSLTAARERLVVEKGRFAWFRDYDGVAQAFRTVLEKGEGVRQAARAGKTRAEGEISGRTASLERKIVALRSLVADVKDRRLSRRKLMEAEIGLEEAKSLARAGRTGEARKKIDEADREIDTVLRAVRPLLERFADSRHISRWRQLAAEAIAESKRHGQAILVKKLDRKLILYRNGAVYRTYPAGLGFNYLTDKLHSGDLATPEGRYKVVRKLTESRYYRALLIDYPNEEDRRRYAEARKGRSIPGNVGIGSLIEIHGGGKDGMTNGCVALENDQMKELFALVDVGTPVIIVGTLESDNVIASALKCLE